MRLSFFCFCAYFTCKLNMQDRHDQFLPITWQYAEHDDLCSQQKSLEHSFTSKKKVRERKITNLLLLLSV